MSKVHDAHFFRLTRSYDECNEVFIRLGAHPDVLRAIVFEHPKGARVTRTHIHAFVQYRISRDTIKNVIKKVVGVVNKQDWSFKDCNIEEVSNMITYMSKGEYEPKFVKGFEQQFIDKCKSEWTPPVDLSQKYNDIKKYDEKRINNKYTRMDIVEMIAKDLVEAKADGLKWGDIDDDDRRDFLSRVDDEELFDYTLKVLFACKIIPGAYKYMDYAVAVRMFYNSPRNPNYVYQNMLHKFKSGLYKL